MKNYYIECTNLFKIYKASDLEVVALRGLELFVNKGEIISIIGSSGSGKSTLLNILAGYDFPSAGKVNVGNYDLLQMSNEEIVRYRRSEVGFIWQDTNKNLFNYLSAIENIKLPMNYIWLSYNQMIDLIKKRKIDIEARLFFGILNFKGTI